MKVLEVQERTRGTMREIKVYDTVWVDMSNWETIPPHESGYAVVVDMWASTDTDTVSYKVMYAVRFCGSDEVIVVNEHRVTHINDDEDTQEDTMHDKHYRDSVVEPILVMQDFFSHDELIGFLKGNILKYRLRAGHKGGEKGMKDDLDKIHTYEEWLERAKKGKRI